MDVAERKGYEFDTQLREVCGDFIQVFKNTAVPLLKNIHSNQFLCNVSTIKTHATIADFRIT